MRALVVAMMLASTAWAGPLAERGLQAYERVEYAEAAQLFRRALAEETLDARELERVYLWYGSALLGAGDEALAERAFATLLTLNPSYRPDADVSPKVRAAIKRAGTPPSPPRIEHAPPGSWPRERAVEIEARVQAPSTLRAMIEYRRGGVPVREPLQCVGERCSIKLPPSSDERLIYRFGLRTPEGALALPSESYELALKQTHVPIHRRWWLWTTIGVVVAAGVATAVGVTVAQQQADESVRFAARRDSGGGAHTPLWP